MKKDMHFKTNTFVSQQHQEHSRSTNFNCTIIYH